MTASNPSTVTKLFLKRTLAAPREKVFKAWTDAAEIKKWFAPGPMQTPIAEIDLRVGGKYRIVMKDLSKDVLYVRTGVYREIRPPEKLVFTWTSEGNPQPGETLVTIEFREKGKTTELLLTHEFFSDEESKKRHNEGWIGCLDKLEKVL